MNYPLISEYVEAIKAAEDNFDQLKHLRPVLGEDGEPVMTSGNFAVVFKMKDEQTGKLHAVKCFLKEQEGRAEAYRQIAEELEFVSSTFLTPIKYLDKELFVDSANSEDSEFPVLLMDWVEGQTLDKYIREHIDDQYELSLLAYQFSRLAMWLMPQPFAHGDLKPDNILVKEDGTLVLVDYDGMYVPAMKGQKARELGSPDFRHPGRTEEVFDDHIDDFSLASILLSLKAIALQPSLLDEYGASDRLLFSEKDYRNLSESSALGALQPLMQDAELASLYSLYILALSQNNLSQVSFRLFNLDRPKGLMRIGLGTEVQDQDDINYWVDEIGARYSTDRMRLIEVPDGLEEYVIRPGTKVICDNAFGLAAEDLNHVVIPQSVLMIGKDAFAGCLNLHQVIIPDNVIEIKEGAFCESGLKSITIPEGIRNIEVSVFNLCEKLETVKLPNSIKTIGDLSFSNCSKLKTIIIPNSVCKIGNFAFRDCQELKSVIMSDGLDTIGENVFYGCCSLNCICVSPNYRLKYEKLLYEYKDKLVEYDGDGNLSEEVTDEDLANAWTDEYGAKYSKDKMRLLKVPKELRDYSIAEGTMVICNHVFTDLIDRLNYFVKGLKKSDKGIFTITMPNSVKLIGKYAFAYCCYLTSIYIPVGTKQKYEVLLPNYKDKLVEQYDEENLSTEVTEEEIANAWVDEYGAKYSQDRKRLLWVPKNLTDYSIRKETMIICNYSFMGCEELTKIHIPDGVRIIGYCAFKNCISLSTVFIPNTVTKLGSSSFEGCSRLTRLKLPDSIKTIGKYVFMDCVNLSFIVLPSRIAKIEERTFSGCHELSCIEIPDSVTEIKEGAFIGCKNIASIHIPKSVQIIGDLVFSGCESLSSVEIPDGVSQLGGYLFARCKSLRSIFIPNSIIKLDGFDPDGRIIRTFDHCVSLLSIYIPKGTIEKFKKLLPESKSILVEQDEDENLSTNVTEEDLANALRNVKGILYSEDEKRLLAVSDKNISRYKIKEGTKIICDFAFDACRYLEEIIIPNSVVKLGNRSFSGCDIDLKEIAIPNSVTDIGNEAFYGCSNLKSLLFPQHIKKISMKCFAFCESLESIILPEEILEIEEFAFFYCKKLASVTFTNTIMIIGDNIFCGCDDLKTIIIPVGSKEKFEQLLPDDKDKLVEQELGWRVKETRHFNSEEISMVSRAKVVPSDGGKSVCFFMNTGGKTYIPLSKQSKLTVGDSVDMKTAKLITLCQKGKADIKRIIE